MASNDKIAKENISIHALLAESDREMAALGISFIFLSTLSLRRATGFGGNTLPS